MTVIHKTVEHSNLTLKRGTGLFTCTCSTENEDRHGDVIVQRGISWKAYSKNPVVLGNHNHDAILGVSKNLRIENNELRADIELAPEGTSPRIDEMRKLVDAGILKAVSIGFFGTKTEPLIKDGRRTGTRYLESELCEISLVAVGSNRESVAVAKSLKISDATMRAVFNQVKKLTLGQKIRAARRRVAKAERMAANSPTAYQRAVWERVLARFQRDEIELRERASRPVSPLEELQVRANELSAEIRQIEAEIRRAQDPWGVNERAKETEAAFTKTQKQIDARLPKKPEYRASADANTTPWRGMKVDQRATWKGRKV